MGKPELAEGNPSRFAPASGCTRGGGGGALPAPGQKEEGANGAPHIGREQLCAPPLRPEPENSELPAQAERGGAAGAPQD